MSTKLTPAVQSAITNIVEPAVANTPKPVESTVVVSDVITDEGESLEGFWGGEVTLEGLEKLPDGEASYKGLKPLKEYVNYLPVEVRKQLHNMQTDYTRKTQEIAQLRKELEAERATIKEDRDHITRAMEEFEQGIGEEISEDEIYASADGLKKFIRQQAIKNQQELYKPLHEKLKAEQTAVADKQAYESAKSFVDSKPEFKDQAFKTEVAKLIQEKGMELEHAYLIVKGKTGQSLEEVVDKSNTRSKQKSILGKISGGGGSKTLPSLDVKGLSAAQKLEAISNYKDRYGRLPPKGK